MTAKILDGKVVAEDILDDIKRELRKYCSVPCLAVLLCTDDPASEIYVRKKREACEEVGLTSILFRPFEGGIEKYNHPKEHLLSMIHFLNEDPAVDGILVQLPLPKDLDQYEVFDIINPLKDVDVFNPINTGLLVQGRPRFVPCTPQAIQELLTRHNIEISGKKVCIINRSDVVGRPLSALLIQDHGQANATVVTCHDRTPPDLLKKECLSSDIIVVAVGQPNFLTSEMVSPNVVVVDVGITRCGKKIVGDVDFDAVAEKASWISRSIGGVGPVTVACLLKNTLRAYSLRMENAK